MPWIRQLDSGLWAATVRLPIPPPKNRVTQTHKLKGVVEAWAGDLEADIRRGDWIDPRAGKVTVGECWDRWKDARRLERASRKRDESHWRCHVAPRWASTPIGAIFQPDVSAWVVEMERAHRDDCTNRKRCQGCRHGAATIQGSLGVLRAILEQAVKGRLIRLNPARGVSAPEREAHLDRILDGDEQHQLLDALDRHHPGYPAARLLCELMLDTGVRWEEAAAVDREHVEVRTRIVHIGPVMEKDGTVRPYPKSPAGKRPVPVSDELWPRFRRHVLTVPAGGMVFTAPRGGHLLYDTWHRRVWTPAIHGAPARRDAGDWSAEALGAYLDERMGAGGFATDKALAAAAGLNASMLSHWRHGRFRPRRRGLDALAAALGSPAAELHALAGLAEWIRGAGLDDPQPTPHDLRHTYGTMLADAGVLPHEMMKLMGHEKYESTQRYIHAGDGRFDRSREAVAAARRKTATHG